MSNNNNAIKFDPSDLCKVTYEELRNDEKLGFAELCPVCKIQVGHHNRQSTLVGNTQSNNSNSSSGNHRSVDVPEWKKETWKSVIPFLMRYEQVCKAEQVPESRWTTLLLKAVTNTAEADWVDKNIVEPKLSWTDAKKEFAKHFKNQDYSDELIKEFARCRQGRQESVQLFSDRFDQLCTQLGYADDVVQVINQFELGLSELAQKQTRARLSTIKQINAHRAAEIRASLKIFIEFCIEVDNDHSSNSSSSHISSSSSSNSTHSSSQSHGSKKWCNFHKSSSHSSVECKSNKQELSKPTNNSTPTPSPSGGKLMTKDGRVVKCNNCGGNHYVNKCDKNYALRNRNIAPTNNASNTSNNSNNSTSNSTFNSIPAVKSVAIPSSSSSSVVTEAVFLPKDAQKDVFLYINGTGKFYRCFIDTGAQITLLDKSIQEELSLPLISDGAAGGNLKMAISGNLCPRIGQVKVNSEFFFPGSTYNPISFSNAIFEIHSVRDSDTDYDVLLGMDFIPLIFPNAVPLAYCRNSASKLHAKLSSVTIDEYIPDGEIPDVAQLSTASHLQSKYASHRQALYLDLQDVIVENSTITGFCNLPHSIVSLQLDESKLSQSSIYRRQYSLPHTSKSLADPIIMDWFDKGKIELAPSGCPYNNAMTVVPKKDENNQLTGARPCLDARFLNKVLVNVDTYQIPNIREAFEMHAGCSIFGSVDAEQAFLQLLLDENSRSLTAFTWNNIQYQFVGAPFGLKFLTAHFQRVMQSVFSNMPFVLIYVDNIIFGSHSWEEHALHARAVISRLSSVNIKIKPSSILLGHSQLTCLGHILSSSGISIDPAKTQAIANWPLPETSKALQSFLGLCGFVRAHIRHYADISSPLEAAKNSTTLIWTEEMKSSFETLKLAFSKSCVVGHPDFTRPFHLATDASWTGVGGVLFQPKVDGEHITADNIVGICSKKLNASRIRWPVYRKELFGLIYSLRTFHCYLYGRTDLVVYTDHKPLTYMFESKTLSPALQQWLDVLLDYNFTIVHRDGILNEIPDALSRMYGEAYSQSPVWGVNPNFPTSPLPAISINSVSLSLNGEREVSSQISDPSSTYTSFPSITSSINLAIELEKRGKKSPTTQEEKNNLITQEHSFGHFGVQAIFNQLYHKD